jgi:hypothetical protein
MNKTLRFLLLMIALGSILPAKAQMTIRKLNTLYYGFQEIPVYKVNENGNDKFYLSNIPTVQNTLLPKIVTHFSVNVSDLPTAVPHDKDYVFVDSTDNGYGPYDILDKGNLLIKGIDAVTLYWAVTQTFGYFDQLNYNTTNPQVHYFGVSNKATEIDTLRIGTNTNFPKASTGFADYDLGINNFLLSANTKPYTLDVMGHEALHEILWYTSSSYKVTQICDLSYMVESIADAFGILNKNYVLQKQDPSLAYDWDKKDSFNKPSFNSSSFKSIKEAGFPTAYLGINFDQLNAETHNNRTLIPYWFYLLSQGGTGHIDENTSNSAFNVVGIGRAHAEKILWCIATKFLPAYGSSASWLNFHEAAEKAAIDIYGVNSLELASVRDACFAIGLGLPSTKYLGSFPKDGAKEVNPWPTVLIQKIPQYPGMEQKEWEFYISTTKSFGPGDSFYTIKNSDITYDPADSTIMTKDLSLQPNTTYYTQVRATVFAQCRGMDQSSTACKQLADKLMKGYGIRSFTTDSRGVNALAIEKAHPWGGTEFGCNMLSASNPLFPVDKYHIRIYREKENKPFTETYITSNPALPIQRLIDPSLILNADADYKYDIAAVGMTDIFGNDVNEGLPSEKIAFFTSIPKTLAFVLPDIYPFGPHPLVLKWDPIVGIGAQQKEAYAIEIHNKDNKVIYSEIVDGTINKAGICAKEIEMSVFKEEPRGSKEEYFFNITPLSPELTDDELTVKNNGEMIYKDFPFQLLWYRTQPKPFEPVQGNPVNIDLATGKAKFFVFPPMDTNSPYSDTYHLEIASPDFSSPENIIIDLPNQPFIPYNNNSPTFFLVNFELDLPKLPLIKKWRITSTHNGLVGKPSEEEFCILQAPQIYNVQPSTTDVDFNNVQFSWGCADHSLGDFRILVSNHSGGPSIPSWDVHFNPPFSLPFFANSLTSLLPSTDYEVTVSPLLPGGDADIAHSDHSFFTTKAETKTPPVSMCLDLGLTFDFSELSNLPLNITIRNPEGAIFDFQQVVLGGLWDGTQFDLGAWGGNCGTNGKVKPGDYTIMVKVFKSPGLTPNCPTGCGSFYVGAGGSSFEQSVSTIDYYKDRTWSIPVTIH